MSEKKKILFIYPYMLVGGSTTALLSLLNSLDSEKYSIDLQLFKNSGPLFDAIPSHINVLPEAQRFCGKFAFLKKTLLFVFKGYIFKFIFELISNKKIRAINKVIGECKAKELSKRNNKQYDYAIGFLEGWSDLYLAYSVNAECKYAWIHSTFSKVMRYNGSETDWIRRVDRVVFVADACKKEFDLLVEEMSYKSITVENITDSSYVRCRSLQLEDNDVQYKAFSTSDMLKIVTVCRLEVYTKGLDRVVNCAYEMKERNIPFIWHIVGDGDGRVQLEDMIKFAGVADCLVPVGNRINPYPYIKEADVMCLLSRYEGKPMTVTESMILGTPVLVTEYLSATDQIQHGKSGFIVSNSDESVICDVCDIMQNSGDFENISEYLLQNTYGNRSYVYEIEKRLFNN